MPIISRRNFETVYGTGDLTLEAKKGQSILVKNVMIYEPTAVYAVLKIGNTTVGCFRVNSVLGNHLQIPFGRANHAHNITMGSSVVATCADGAIIEDAGGTETAIARIADSAADQVFTRAMNKAMSSSVGSETILQYLMRKGIFMGYPVASGETFLISLITGATAIKIVEYDIYDEEDITDDMENGSKSNTVTYVSYGDFGADIIAQVDPVLEESNIPPEMPDFPFGKGVPSGKQMELHGILASDVSPAANVAATYTSTRFLKLMRGIEFLCDQELNGIPYYSPFADALGHQDMIAEGYAPGGNYTEIDRREPLMFDPPLEFDAGEVLTVMWNTAIATGSAISQALHEVGFILKIKPKA